MTGGAQTFKLRRTLDRLWGDLEIERRSQPDARLLTTAVHLSSAEGELRLALGQSGDRHLLVPVPSATQLSEDSKSAGVRLWRRDLVFNNLPVTFVDLECRRTDLTGVFTGLTADVCERVSSAPENAAGKVVLALEEWRALLGLTRRPWTAELVAGLHGELIVLERALRLDGDAVRLWGGPSGAPHDFHSVHHALEVKTTTRPTGRVIRIHGVDQLERPHGGDLTLAWLRILESTNGATLAERIQACVAVSIEPQRVLTELDWLDLPATDKHLVSGDRFELVEERWFDVDDQFPRITPDVFAAHSVPGGIGAVEYSADLDVVGAWDEIGTDPLTKLVADR